MLQELWQHLQLQKTRVRAGSVPKAKQNTDITRALIAYHL